MDIYNNILVFWFYLCIYLLIFFIAVQLQLSCLSLHCSPSHSHSQSSLIVRAHESSIRVSLFAPSPSFPIILLPPPLCSLFPSLCFCFSHFCFVDWVPLIGEIIWYLSFISWLISLSIILSSSIHAVVKGRGSFFLSAA